MQRFALFAAIVSAALVLGAAPGHAGPAQRKADEAAMAASAQAAPPRVRPRARTQIRVYPRYPYRTFHTFYPLPYPIEYPGPNAVRHCVSNLVPEYRLSGTVIVPRTRCWWARR